MYRCVSYLLLVLFFGQTAAAAPLPMFDPVIDDPDREWCYGGRTTTVIGTPFQPDVTQITYDGALFSVANAELHFFYGDERTPLLARQRTWYNGWIPIVMYDWKDGDIHYELEVFGSEVAGIGNGNTINYAQMKMTNAGTSPAVGLIGAGLRATGRDYRKGAPKHPVRAETKVTIDNGMVRFDDRLTSLFSTEGVAIEAIPGIPYQAPYLGGQYGIAEADSHALTIYRKELKAGESFRARFVLPRVALSDPKQIAALQATSHDSEKKNVIAYWEDLFGDTYIMTPEARINGSYRGSLVHLALATRSKDGVDGKRQGSGLPYTALFLNDYMDMMLAWVRCGAPQFDQHNIAWLKGKQIESSGMFIDIHNRGNDTIVTSHGQAVFSLAYPPVFAGDVEAGRDVFEAVRKGVELIIADHQSGKYKGLLRPSIPYDAPMVTGLHSCHNLFALSGLRVSIRLARLIGENELADQWTAVEKTYAEAIKMACKESFDRYGWVRSGLYDWTAGTVQARGERINEYPNQDWENVLLAYPTELLSAQDNYLVTTLDVIRRNKYREGVMTYRNGMHIHQYVTVNLAHQYLVAGEQKKALSDLYHILLHNGPTHEGFENLVEPWTDRTPRANCPPPHAWAAAKIALFMRNMMVLEYGGLLGMEEGQRDLYLYSLMSPAWAKEKESITIRNIPTEFGVVNSTMTFSDDGAAVMINGEFKHPPRRIAIRIPYFVEIDSFRTNAKESSITNDVLFCSPDVTEVTFKWHVKPGIHDGTYQELLCGYRSEYPRIMKEGEYAEISAPEPFLTPEEEAFPAVPLSFATVRTAFSHEYKRRFDEFVAKGGTPRTVEPPAISIPGMSAVPMNCPSLTTGKPATASSVKELAHLANNGVCGDRRQCWTARAKNDWLQIDLEKDTIIGRIVADIPASGRRDAFPQYVVEYSQEGGMWTILVDMSNNRRRPMPGEGFEHTFKPVNARYLRIRAVSASESTPLRLSELQAFGE